MLYIKEPLLKKWLFFCEYYLYFENLIYRYYLYNYSNFVSFISFMKYILTILILFVSLCLKAQDCTYSFPFIKGSGMEMLQYNKNNKVIGKVFYTIDSVYEIRTIKYAIISSRTYNLKNKELSNYSYTINCCKSNLTISSLSLFDPSEFDSYEEYDTTIYEASYNITSNMNVDTLLSDASFNFTAFQLQNSVFEFKMDCRKRKVVSKEIISTAIGDFECFKIESNIIIVGKSLINKYTIKSKIEDYYTKGIGLIKRNLYDDNDKLINVYLLNKVY